MSNQPSLFGDLPPVEKPVVKKVIKEYVRRVPEKKPQGATKKSRKKTSTELYHANLDKLKNQNKTVYEHLKSGNTIDRAQAIGMNITALNSRISELRNKYGVVIYDRISPNKKGMKEYSLTPFDGNPKSVVG